MSWYSLVSFVGDYVSFYRFMVFIILEKNAAFTFGQ